MFVYMPGTVLHVHKYDLNPPNSRYYYPRFIFEKREAQRGEGTFPKTPEM